MDENMADTAEVRKNENIEFDKEELKINTPNKIEGGVASRSIEGSPIDTAAKVRKRSPDKRRQSDTNNTKQSSLYNDLE